MDCLQLPKELQELVTGEKRELDVKVIMPDTYVQEYPNGLPLNWKRKAFILNITEGENFTKRKGAENDAIYMNKLFTGLDFEITEVPNSEKDKHNIKKRLIKFEKDCKRDQVDCIVVFMGSHGAKDVIQTSDGNFLEVYNDIIYPCQFEVREEKNGKSVEKRVVRIFINSSCQVDLPEDLKLGKPRKVVMKDSIYAVAQIPKFEAERDEYCGSYYAVVLTYVFMTKACNTPVLELFYEVQKLLPEFAKCGDAIQHPPVIMGLNEPFYFFKNPHDIQFDVLPPVHLFTGRKAELRDLHFKFQQQNSINLDAKKVAIVGLGGIGKSELARAYCQHFVGAVIWLNAETEKTLTDGFHEVAKKHLKISSENVDEKEESITLIVKAVFKYFIGKACLFVFDNVEDVKIFQKFSQFPNPNPAPPFILITSQVNRWTFKSEELLELLEMTEADAVELVKRGLSSTEDIPNKIVIKLIRTLQCLPLALEQAISYINRESRLQLQPNAIEHYLELHKSSSKIPFVSGTALGFHRHTKTIYTTFWLTMGRISETQDIGKYAVFLLHILAYFQPDKIPTKMFLTDDHKEALHLLLDFSVVNNIQSQKRSIRIHRLLQAFVRLEIRETQLEEKALWNALILLSQKANEDTAVHLFSVLKYCNNMKALNFVMDHALSVHFQDSNIMTSLLNSPNGRKCITIEKNGNNEKDWKVVMDLRILIGIGSNPQQVPETYILSYVLQTNEEARAKIIVHPVVQVFVDLKWNKMKYPIYFTMTLTTTWLILSAITFTNSFKTKHGFMSDDGYESYTLENSSCFWWLFVFTPIWVIKETIEMLFATKAPSYWRLLEKACDWILTIQIYRLVNPVFQIPVELDYNVSLVTLVLSYIMVVGQIFKHGDVMRMLAELCKKLIPTVSMVGAGFAFVSVTFVWSIEEYITKSPSELCYKIEERMRIENPEIDVNFHDVCVGRWFTGVAFGIVTFLNVLLYFVLSSVLPSFKTFVRKARKMRLIIQLEQMFMMETLMKKSSALLPYAPLIEESYMVTKNRTIMSFWPLCLLKPKRNRMKISPSNLEDTQSINKEDPYVVTKRMSEFSRRCQILLKNWDALNQNEPN